MKTVIKFKIRFSKIMWQILHRNLMMSRIKLMFRKSPITLHVVDMISFIRDKFVIMVDYLMVKPLFIKATIASPVIRVDNTAFLNIFSDNPLKCTTFNIRNGYSSYRSIPLYYSNNRLFARSPAASLPLPSAICTCLSPLLLLSLIFLKGDYSILEGHFYLTVRGQLYFTIYICEFVLAFRTLVFRAVCFTKFPYLILFTVRTFNSIWPSNLSKKLSTGFFISNIFFCNRKVP